MANEIKCPKDRKLIKEGLSSIMVAHLNVPSISKEGLPTSLSKDVIQGILKDELKNIPIFSRYFKIPPSN